VTSDALAMKAGFASELSAARDEGVGPGSGAMY